MHQRHVLLHKVETPTDVHWQNQQHAWYSEGGIIVKCLQSRYNCRRRSWNAINININISINKCPL